MAEAPATPAHKFVADQIDGLDPRIVIELEKMLEGLNMRDELTAAITESHVDLTQDERLTRALAHTHISTTNFSEDGKIRGRCSYCFYCASRQDCAHLKNGNIADRALTGYSRVRKFSIF
jgi:hypothetical protein